MSAADDKARRFDRGETDRGETAELVRSLLLEGPPVEAAGEAVEPLPDRAALASTLERAMAKATTLEAEGRSRRRRAEELLAALLPLPPAERLEAVENDPDHPTWELAELLEERSFAAGTEDPERARELARLAVAVAERVPPGPESEALRADLEALAWAQLGNAERIANDLPAAATALARAEELLARGTGDPLPRARAASFVASLRSYQTRFDEAVAAAERAANLYRRAGDHHGQGRTLLKLGAYHAYRDELDLACRRLDRAAELLDREREPRLLFVAHHVRASCLERAGRLEEAEAELAEAGRYAEASLDRLRVGWFAGRFALARGETEAGEGALAEVREAFIERGLGYEAAQVSLELAGLYAEQGRTADQRRLAEEMVPLFASRGVHPEARAALDLFCDAVRKETATAALAREVADYLDRARGRPGLTFRRTGA